MVTFWQALIMVLLFGVFMLASFVIGYRAGRKEERLIVTNDLPDPVNLQIDDEEIDEWQGE